MGCGRRDLQHGGWRIQEQDRWLGRWLHAVRADGDHWRGVPFTISRQRQAFRTCCCLKESPSCSPSRFTLELPWPCGSRTGRKILPETPRCPARSSPEFFHSKDWSIDFSFLTSDSYVQLHLGISELSSAMEYRVLLPSQVHQLWTVATTQHAPARSSNPGARMVANNLANLGTAGYRGQQATFARCLPAAEPSRGIR